MRGIDLKVAHVGRHIGINLRDIQRIGCNHALPRANSEFGRGVEADNKVKNSVIIDICQIYFRDGTPDAPGFPFQPKAHSIPVKRMDFTLGEEAVAVKKLEVLSMPRPGMPL